MTKALLAPSSTFLKRRSYRKHFLTLSLMSFFLFIVFTFVVREDVLRGFDFDMTVRIQDDIPRTWDGFFTFLSIAGNFEIVTGLIVLLLIMRRKIMGIFAFALYGLGHVLELIGKMSLDHPGPPRMFLRTHETDFPQFFIFTKASYPSGHSMRILILTILVFFIIYSTRKLPQFIKMLLYTVFAGAALTMLLSRVSLGEHWTTDVIGGALLGAAIGFLSLAFL